MRDLLDFIMDEIAILTVLWGLAITFFWAYIETENWWYLLPWAPYAFFAFIKLLRFALDLKEGTWKE